MKKLSIFFALIVMLAGVSAQAQKKNTRIQPITPPPIKQLQCVQDDEGDGFFMFDMVTGDFTCNVCEYGYEWKGKGQVKIDGFNVYFTAITEEYNMFVSLNVWDKQGKAVIELYKLPDGKYDIEPMRENWVDGNIYDNSMNCYKLSPH